VTLRFRLVDVFAVEPYKGNGLAVFPDRGNLTAGQMQTIARELNQAESVFLDSSVQPNQVTARIFTPSEELPFAGHPLLGAAAVLHFERCAGRVEAKWELVLAGGRIVRVNTSTHGGSFIASMDQGVAEFLPPLAAEKALPFLQALGLEGRHRHPSLPLQVVSTGLPHLIVPLREGIDSARIIHPAFGELLASVGARFAYLLDPETPEGRNWDNTGAAEDPATGSAAGPAVAFLVRHGLRQPGIRVAVRQGGRIGRPSEIRVTVERDHDACLVTVEGVVWPVGEGVLAAPRR